MHFLKSYRVEVMNEKVDIIQRVYGSMRSIKEHSAKKYPERAWLYWPATKWFELVNEGMEKGRPMLWYFFMLCPEIFWAMDITTFSPEYAFGIMAALGITNKYIDLANTKVPDHICAANKFPIGFALSGETVIPEMIVYAAANPCDSALATYSNLIHYYQIPSFFLDIPHLSEGRAYKYVGRQLKKMVTFIEERSKQKLDLDRLREVTEYSNQAQDYFLKLKGLRKNIPSPISSRSFYVTGGAMMGLCGIPEFVVWMKERYESAKMKSEKGEGAIPEEKIRLVWIANCVDFDLSIFEWLENNYGAVMVESLLVSFPSEFIDNTGDVSRIYESLARRIMEWPMARQGRVSADAFIMECISTARDFNADAVIFAGNNGCKFNWVTAQLVKERINEELGIPVLLFELCPWDPRFVSMEVIKEKFDRFFELFF